MQSVISLSWPSFGQEGLGHLWSLRGWLPAQMERVEVDAWQPSLAYPTWTYLWQSMLRVAGHSLLKQRTRPNIQMVAPIFSLSSTGTEMMMELVFFPTLFSGFEGKWAWEMEAPVSREMASAMSGPSRSCGVGRAKSGTLWMMKSVLVGASWNLLNRFFFIWQVRLRMPKRHRK